MKVKICGLKEKEHVIAAVNAGADFIGFVFAKSSRQITAARAKELISLLPPHVKSVGVFVNPGKEELLSLLEETKLDYVQLHGDESVEFCEEVPVPVIKALPIRSVEDINRAANFPVYYHLIDAPGTDYHGGSGRRFDWSLVEESQLDHSKVFLAGGLHAGNVKEAIKRVQPFAVDVSSGVETDGKKDINKIKLFIEQAKMTGSDQS
ncbi:phosphoribosylanthranilate isomerase [Jeotgalibacillus soli]|uniref:N-(5'-phosphoribosyl)anthranilate isomerase n=1 Tax=Jeotgalibacillus soli TaxID=889306 RepID=A0A0C2RUV9_9BACL|nr:phosphoribosylanthranilate isomerase [Jeotgalibacillus soli]KIL45494.1 phosphoribosylanthranilate isomerase [Jeotgalibacillus soli]